VVTQRQQSETRPRPGRRQLLRGGVGLAGGSVTAFVLVCSGTKEEAKPSAPSGAAPSTAAPAAAASTPAPRRGGRYFGSGTSGNHLNPVALYQEGHNLSGFHVYDRLISQRPNKDFAKEYVLEAAQTVEQPDPTTVIFKLKPGMKFHDRAPVSGRAVTADDVVQSQLYTKQEPRAENNSFQNQSMQSVEAPDAQTVVFKLKAPNAYVFAGTQMANPGAQCIFPKENIGQLDTAWQIGSGPYTLAEYDLNARYLYKRNETYREASKGLPHIAEREFKIIVDPAAQEAAFRSEQVHVWIVPFPNLADQIKKDLSGRIEMTEYLSLSMNTFSANVTKPPWNDVRVREAVYRILNRQQYVDLMDKGKGAVPPGPLSIGLTDYQLTPAQTEKYFRQDARAAKQLLDAAGFDFNRQVEMITIQGARNESALEIFQNQASQVGMKVQLLPVSSAEFLQQRVLKGNWETWIAQHPAYDSPQVPLRLQHTTTNNFHQFNGLRDPQVDAMIDKSEQTVDRNDRIKLVKDIQIALLEKYTPFVWLQNFTVFLARWKYVRDYEVNPVSVHPMYRIEMWLDK
jgi:ABC-type transport system substrate-binding protein